MFSSEAEVERIKITRKMRMKVLQGCNVKVNGELNKMRNVNGQELLPGDH